MLWRLLYSSICFEVHSTVYSCLVIFYYLGSHCVEVFLVFRVVSFNFFTICCILQTKFKSVRIRPTKLWNMVLYTSNLHTDVSLHHHVIRGYFCQSPCSPTYLIIFTKFSFWWKWNGNIVMHSHFCSVMHFVCRFESQYTWTTVIALRAKPTVCFEWHSCYEQVCSL